MHLKNVASIGFVTSVLFSTGFILYFTSRIGSSTIRKEHIIKALSDEKKSHRILTSLPRKYTAPNMVKTIRLKTIRQIEIGNEGSLPYHKLQHLASDYAVEVTRDGITKSMDITQGNTASEQSQHGDAIKHRLQTSSGTTTASPIHYQYSSDTADRENIAQPNHVPMLHALSSRNTNTRKNKFLKNNLFPRSSASTGMTNTSPKFYQYSNPTAREQFKHGVVTKPRLQLSYGLSTTSPIYNQYSRNTADSEDIAQSNHVPRNFYAHSRNTFSRRNRLSRNTLSGRSMYSGISTARNAAASYRQQLPRRTLAPKQMSFWTNLYRLIKARKRHANVLAMSQKLCTNDTCLLLEDPFPIETVEDSYLKQAWCLSSATLFLNRTLSITDNTLRKCKCHLRSYVGKEYRVGIVSMPGSGNTWVRGLLEQVTYICTGSLWCDGNLRATHFCAEGLRSTNTLAVKNHDPTIRWRGQSLPKNTLLHKFSDFNKPEFDAVIFIQRNPFDSLVAEHNRALAHSFWEEEVKRSNFTTVPPNDHVRFFGHEYFYDNSLWNETVYKGIDSWGEMVQHLLVDSKNYSILPVHYEDLKYNLFYEMKRMLKFLEYDITENTLRERLDQKFTDFYRNHTAKFEHYTSEQKEYMNSVIASKIEIGLPLKQYICP